ncbi:hypothetical protein BGZ99_003330 [Dissophora globulifera]|uniref:Uncharacterized protein n=1 Tax=Dissophora globulifera TaxID=979702 RepID=A0A9P6RNL4_9FUNG|nr:hypothetical protein BGZ99_003330 [Dissophora globulifera]
MMSKSAFTTLFVIAALVAVASAQAPTTTAPAPVATTTTTSAPSATITTAPAAGGSNFTSIPNFSSLATLIQSYANGRSQSPGSAPTGASGSSAGGSAFMLAESARTSVLAGLSLVFATALMAAFGTIGL